MEDDQIKFDELKEQMSEIKELTHVDPVTLIQLINLWIEEKRSP